MSNTTKNGAMVALAAGGVLALAATAEFGIPAIVVGAGMSLLSGALAMNNPNPHKRIDSVNLVADSQTGSSHRRAS